MDKCKLCSLQDCKPCYECNSCMTGNDHFKPMQGAKTMDELKTCPFCGNDWGISDPNTGRHWVQKINYCPKCGRPLNRRAQPENKPLNLEQLRQMDGEPVWVETGEVTINEQIIGRWDVIGTQTHNTQYFKTNGKRWLGNYGKTWLAYAHKPEQEEK